LTPWEAADDLAVLDAAGAEPEALGEVGVVEAPDAVREAELLLEAPEVADAAGVELTLKVTPTARQRPWE
jgi:hypothetical protein